MKIQAHFALTPCQLAIFVNVCKEAYARNDLRPNKPTQDTLCKNWVGHTHTHTYTKEQSNSTHLIRCFWIRMWMWMELLSFPLFRNEREKRVDPDSLVVNIFQALTSRGGNMPCTQDTSPLSLSYVHVWMCVLAHWVGWFWQLCTPYKMAKQILMAHTHSHARCDCRNLIYYMYLYLSSVHWKC